MKSYQLVNKFTDKPKNLSEDEFRDLKATIECFRPCYEIESSYEILLDSYIDFSQALSEQTLQAVMERGFSNLEISMISVSNKFNRLFANFLSAFSTYKDHCKKSTVLIDKMGSGNKTSLKGIFDKGFEAQIDSAFGFRCCEFLRNHVLHESKTIKGYSLMCKRNEDGKETFSCSPTLPTNQFSPNGRKYERICLEIQSQSETLNIRQVATECIDACSVIHAVLRIELQQFMAFWYQRCTDVLENHELTFEGYCAYVIREENESGDIIEIPLVDLRVRMKYIENNNAAPLHLFKTLFL